jgi:hypothetical protein
MSEQAEEVPVPQDSRNRPVASYVNALDGRIAGCTDTLNFAVEKSGMNVTHYSEKASSATTSGCNFTVVVPTMSTIVDRVVYLRTKLTFTVSGTPPSGTTNILDGGYTVAPFPFHHLCTSIQATINNQSFSFDCIQALPMVMRLLDKDILDEYCTVCPTVQDFYGQYSSVPTGSISDPFADAINFLSLRQVPRKAYITSVVNSDNGASPPVRTATVVVEVVEPLLLSPFLLNNLGPNSAGIYGINTLKFLFQFKTEGNRVLRFKNAPYLIKLTTIDDAYLDFTLLTPHPSQAKSLVSRNIVPYMDINVQKTQCNKIIRNNDVSTVLSNNFQLSMIPDKVMICFRKVIDNQTTNDADACLPINAVRINFANRNGLLAGCQAHQLYEMSRNAGAHISWPEFKGSTLAGGNSVVTAGSFLTLDFAKHISISEDYFAPGSLGQFSFYISLDVYNNTGADIAAGSYELALMFMNSGMLINELGSSSLAIGLLTKDVVLETANQVPVNIAEYNRMYGSGWWSSVKSAFRKAKKYVKPIAKVAKVATGLIPHPYAQGASQVLGALGAGRTGGGYSGGSLRDRLM